MQHLKIKTVVHMNVEYTWTDYKTNTQIAKELKITPVLDKLLEYKRSWIQHVNRMPRNRLPRVMKYYCPTGGRNHGRPLKRLLDTWDRNGSTSGATPWKIYDDDDDDDECWVYIQKRCACMRMCSLCARQSYSNVCILWQCSISLCQNVMNRKCLSIRILLCVLL